MSFHPIISYKDLKFDDYTNDNASSVWTQVCKDCLEKNKDVFEERFLDDEGSGICGVLGCDNGDDSVRYYSFEPGKIKGVNLKFKASKKFCELVDLLGVLDVTDIKTQENESEGFRAECVYEITFFLHSVKREEDINSLIQDACSQGDMFRTSNNLSFHVKQGKGDHRKVYFSYIGKVAASSLKMETDIYQEAKNINKALEELYNTFR